MQAPSLPPDEARRLEALRGLDVLDTPPEAEFDAVVRLAASLLGVPIALVTLVDAGRQWFKARIGLEVESTERSISFCGHVVADGAPLIVPDAAADPRFEDNPLVTGAPHIRFYAGVPLRMPSGAVLGTLCVIDRAPRTLTAAQQESLSLLAQQATALLRMRRQTLAMAHEQVELETFRQFFDLAPDLLCTLDAQLRFVEFNAAWRETLGWPADALRGRSMLDLVHPDDRPGTLLRAAELQPGQAHVGCCENRLRHEDGHWVHLSWTIRASAGRTFCVARDVTAERAERRALRDREQRLRVLLETMAEGVVMHDAAGRLLHCNAAAERHFGLSRAELEAGAPDHPAWQATHEDGAPFPLPEHPQAQVRRTGEAQTGVRVFVHHPDGRRSTLSIDARPIVLDDESGRTAAMSVVRDITEENRLRRMADRLARQERFVATGTLAAGVGHEINNPLSYVMGNIDYVLEELDRRSATEVVRWLPECRAILREARDGAERVRKIVRGLRALAQEGGPVRPTSVEAAVRQALDTAAHALRRRATVEVQLDDLPPVAADETRLTQVLVHLLVNAGQCFADDAPEKNRVTLRAVQHGLAVDISVTDNGPGMDARTLPRIFDPFFTTRPVGQGMGLGLSISEGIVTGFGGALTCESSPGAGARFNVRLASTPPTATEDDAGLLHVLVIDDDQAILAALEFALGDNARVVSVSDPRDALLVLARERFDAVLCDVMMTHLTGLELHARVAHESPVQAARFVFITGGPADVASKTALEALPNPCLRKPLRTLDLRAAIRNLGRWAS